MDRKEKEKNNIEHHGSGNYNIVKPQSFPVGNNDPKYIHNLNGP